MIYGALPATITPKIAVIARYSSLYQQKLLLLLLSCSNIATLACIHLIILDIPVWNMNGGMFEECLIRMGMDDVLQSVLLLFWSVELLGST